MEWQELCTVNWCAVRLESLHPTAPCREVDGHAQPLTRGRSGRKRNTERERKKKKTVTQKNRNPNLYKCCFDIYKKISVSVNRENWETVAPLQRSD